MHIPLMNSNHNQTRHVIITSLLLSFRLREPKIRDLDVSVADLPELIR